MPKYSIITVATNGLEHTLKCVESVLKNTKDFELIVVDNASNDGTSGYLDDKIHANPETMRVIRTENRYSFSAANNIGLKIADERSEYIIFLNNDTIVSENWVERMEAHFKNCPLKNIGMVGPVSSSSNGRQMVGVQDPESWYEQRKGHWSQAGVLYGWCMMIPRKVLSEVMDEDMAFDERFENSHEDNDLCLRIQKAGYKLVIAQDTYIYHRGQGTLSGMMTIKQYSEAGYKNRELYYEKWYVPGKKKLVAVYRTNNGKWLDKSLEQTSKFADSIILHFCRADFGSVPKEEIISYFKKRFPKIVHIEFYNGIFQEDYERGRLLELALEMHEKGEADWCISIDDDEIYEDKFIDRVHKMINPRNPEILGYWCQWRTIWETRLGVEYYRTDSTFGQFTNYRLFRLMKGQEISSHHPEGHHCGSAPLIAEENLRWSNIRVKHMGYDTPEQRQKKFEFYEANDHFKTKADIGYDDYSHLISKNVQLEKYEPNNGISLVMMIKNECDLILDCLEHVQNLVDEYVIVDTGSTDGTLEIVKKFAKHAIVPVKILEYPWEDNYSTPRNFGIYNATQKWILHLDADERFKYNDLIEIFKASETETEIVVFHVLNYLKKVEMGKRPEYASTESIRLFRNMPELYYTGILHETLDDALAALRVKRPIQMMRFSGHLHHYGYLKDKDKVRGKLDYYEKLNLNQIEITNDSDPRPHFNLALHYLNDAKEHLALKAFQRCLEINPRFWHAQQQMAALNMKNAKMFLQQLTQCIPSSHPFKGQAEKIINFIESNSHGCQKVV